METVDLINTLRASMKATRMEGIGKMKLACKIEARSILNCDSLYCNDWDACICEKQLFVGKRHFLIWHWAKGSTNAKALLKESKLSQFNVLVMMEIGTHLFENKRKHASVHYFKFSTSSSLCGCRRQPIPCVDSLLPISNTCDSLLDLLRYYTIINRATQNTTRE